MKMLELRKILPKEYNIHALALVYFEEKVDPVELPHTENRLQFISANSNYYLEWLQNGKRGDKEILLWKKQRTNILCKYSFKGTVL